MLPAAEDAAPCWRPSRSMESMRPSAARGAKRKNRAPRNASTPSATPMASGTPKTSARNCGTCITAASTKARAFAPSRFPTGPSWTCGSTSRWSRSPWCRCTSPSRGACCCAARCSSRWTTTCRPRPATVSRRCCAACARWAAPTAPGPSARTPDTLPEDHRGAARLPALGAREPRHRPRPGRLHGDLKKREGYLLMKGSAALHHRRQRGRRQIHAHRPPAARYPRGLRRPARIGAQSQPGSQRRGFRPVADHRRAARRAGAGHYHRRGLPLFPDAAPQIHHRRHAGARAVHAQHGHRGIHGRAWR